VSKQAPFEVKITDDNQVAVEFSDAFIALSMKEQLKEMEAFFWERNLKPQEGSDITTDMVKEEITIVLAESIMAQLKRGQPVQQDGKIDITLDDLTNLWNISTTGLDVEN
jgi:hypothetical protein